MKVCVITMDKKTEFRELDSATFNWQHPFYFYPILTKDGVIERRKIACVLVSAWYQGVIPTYHEILL